MRNTVYPVQRAGQRAIVTLPVHIDLFNAGQIRDDLLAVIDCGVTALIADMTVTVSCDQAGAGAVVRACQRAAISGTDLRLVVSSEIVRRALSGSGADRLMPIYPSLEALLAALAGPAPRPEPPPWPPAEKEADSAEVTLRLAEDHDRIAAGITDIVVHRLFSASLILQVALGLMGEHRAAGKVEGAMDELDLAIRDLRDMIFHHRRLT